MKDQLEHWNHAHSNQWLHAHSEHQTQFAEEVNSSIPSKATILELGCGEGNDSIYFAKQGHQIAATDFSSVAIEQNKKRWSHPDLSFAEQDISKPLSFADNSFDVVYARLSLHYFPDAITRDIFREINRVLKNGGALCFMCKSTDDSIYGKGDEIEPDMFELEGHVRHFFSKAYVAELLNVSGFIADKVITGEEVIYDRQSAFIKVFATKR